MSLAPGVRLGAYEVIALLGSGGMGGQTTYDILPDGKHFVMIRGADPQGTREVVIAQHWFEELKRLVPANMALTPGANVDLVHRLS